MPFTTNGRRSRHTRSVKRRGGTNARNPPTVHAPTGGVQSTTHIPSTCSPPMDMSSYKNPCVAGTLPLDSAFLSTPMVGGSVVRHSQRKQRQQTRVKHRVRRRGSVVDMHTLRRRRGMRYSTILKRCLRNKRTK